MVCDRCILVVRQQLKQLGIHPQDVSLGTAEINPDPTESQLSQIASSLEMLGFVLMDKEKDKLVERIRTIIIELIHHSDQPELHVNFTEMLSRRLNREYGYLSRLFSESEGITLEKYIIQQKIEKVKELLQYGELNINEISWKMGYSSSAHLSNQFKAVTGQSPKEFKAFKTNNRTPIDKI